MILKLIFVLSNVDSYVLFAANIEDFRSIANKVVPDKLADQLANMAVKRDNLNYRHDINEPVSDSDYGSSDDSTEGSNYSDSFYKTSNPLIKDKAKSSKKKYLLQNENLDLDELVKRVKEKLYNDNKANNEPNPDESSPELTFPQTTRKQLKLEDYYYKDDNMNGNFDKNTEYEEIEKIPLRPAFTTERKQIESMQQYDGVNIDFNNKETKDDSEYAEENTEKTEYIQEYPNENTDYSPVTVKQQSKHVANLKEIVRDGNNGQEVRKFDEYGNIIVKEVSKNIKKVDTNVPEYYEDKPERPKVLSDIYNTKEMNGQKVTDTKIEEVPEYYEDNANEAQIDLAGDVGDIFKEVDMLKSTNDSYEDYVTPKRDNIFDSAEVTTRQSIKPILGVQKFASKTTDLKLQNSRPKAFAEPFKAADHINDEVIKPPRKVSARTPNPGFIRAETASMWYKDPNIENYDDSAKKIKENANKKTTKKRLRTMFPTKAHIKISSPNYFAKLPAVAEKYNFDEPIPEKDREPEVIKYLGNPSAMINKKVKI